MTSTPTGVILLLLLALTTTLPAADPDPLRIGVIGLDTSHSVEFSKLFNAKDPGPDLAGFRVVAAYPQGSRDIQEAVNRVPEYTATMRHMGVEIVDSIDVLLSKVDAVMLESNDGRVHLEQSIPVLRAGKRLFIDKPIAGSLADAIAIFRLADRYKVPVFSSSALRYCDGPQAIRNGKAGQVRGADAFSPAHLQATHPDLYWYGIHGVESLFTVMGPGCESVLRISSPDADVVVGRWKRERIGTFRGIRGGALGYGGVAFGSKSVELLGSFSGYRPLVVQIGQFFRTGKSPVDRAETLEIYAFMSAADESHRRSGATVTLSEVMTNATTEAQRKIAALSP